jgi:perosamine synthetase
MQKKQMNRRKFIATSATTAAVLSSTKLSFSSNNQKLALNGGVPVRTKEWPTWPHWDKSAEDEILSVLRSGTWWRSDGEKVVDFEQAYAKLMGAKGCLATASGTTALLTALHVLDVDAGDEVIVSPYTFIATYNAVLLCNALPVFVDTDPETFLIDPEKIEAKITSRTKAILPVHIYGMPCEMDPINEIAKKHNLVVIEDACQAWLAEYKNKKCGTLGDLGCFSFQNSKNLPAGEGGAVIGDDMGLIDKCESFHNCGRPIRSVTGVGQYPTRGSNKRMQKTQAVILMSQMKRIFKDAETREQNADYLSNRLKKIPGIIPFKFTKGANRSAYHLYPFRYKKENFNNAPKDNFIKALRAEGIPGHHGYHPQYRDGLMDESLNSRGFKRLFSPQRLQQYREEMVLPGNEQLCSEAVVFTQNILLGTKKDMDDIANAIQKIHDNKEQLLKT